MSGNYGTCTSIYFCIVSSFYRKQNHMVSKDLYFDSLLTQVVLPYTNGAFNADRCSKYSSQILLYEFYQVKLHPLLKRE